MSKVLKVLGKSITLGTLPYIQSSYKRNKDGSLRGPYYDAVWDTSDCRDVVYIGTKDNPETVFIKNIISEIEERGGGKSWVIKRTIVRNLVEDDVFRKVVSKEVPDAILHRFYVKTIETMRSGDFSVTMKRDKTLGNKLLKLSDKVDSEELKPVIMKLLESDDADVSTYVSSSDLLEYEAKKWKWALWF